MARIDALGADSPAGVNECDVVSVGGTGGTRSFTVDATRVRAGTRAFRALSSGATVIGSIYGQANFLASATGCVRFSFWIETTLVAPGEPQIISIVNGTSGAGIVLARPNVGGTWQCGFMSAAGVSQGSVDSPVMAAALGRWHDAYLRWSIGGATKTVTFSVDNCPEATATAQAGFVDTTLGQFRFGLAPQPALASNNNTPEGDIYFDDILIDSADAPIDHGRFLICLTPDADIQKQLLLPLTGTHFDDVNDGSDATAVATSIAGAQFDIYGLTDSNLVPANIPPENVTIPAVYASIRAGGLTDTLVGSDQRVMLRLAGTDGTQAQPTVSAVPTTKRSLVAAATRPPAGGLWTPADLDALQIKLGKQSGTLAITYTYQEAWAYAEVAIQANLADASAPTTDAAELRARASLADSSSAADAVVTAVSQALADAGIITDAADIKVVVALGDGSVMVETVEKQVYVVEGLVGGVTVVRRILILDD